MSPPLATLGDSTTGGDMSDGSQARLFRLAPEALAISAHFEARAGWRVTVKVRRADEEWDEARSRVYSHLTTEELFDVIVADLAAGLEL